MLTDGAPLSIRSNNRGRATGGFQAVAVPPFRRRTQTRRGVGEKPRVAIGPKL